MLALPGAKILRSFKCLCAVLELYLSEEMLPLGSSPVAVLKSARGTCRFTLLTQGLVLLRKLRLHQTSECGLVLLL